MKIIAKTGNPDLAQVYIAELEPGKLIEFAESVEPPYPKEKKWVIIISTLCGCPVKCKFCDSGEFYKGKLTSDQMLAQIDFLVSENFPSGEIPSEKFKIQFARMGEPAFNPAVLEVLEKLPSLYKAPGLIPSFSTIAPVGTEDFFDKLKIVKDKYYGKNFQLQFSIHSTDQEQRDWLQPIKKWDFSQIADYGKTFFETGDRKITLNFAVSNTSIIDVNILEKYFDKKLFLIKITPVNPTFTARNNGLESMITENNMEYQLINDLRESGYEVIFSFGELEENSIGSNCGQNILNYIKSNTRITDGYNYSLDYLNGTRDEEIQ